MATLNLGKIISDIQAKYNRYADPYFDNVTLLLNYDNTFTDKSSYNQTITTSGNVAISTTQKKFGPSSGFFPNTPGSDLDYIYTPISSNNSLGSGDFTIESWVYLIDKDDNYPRLIQGSNSLNNWNSTSSWTLAPHHLDNGDVPGFVAVNLNGNAYVVEATTSLSLNVWYHLAVTREGDTFRIFVNGSLEGTSVFSGSIDALPILYQIGGIDFTTSENTNGYIDDTRITKGIARYTESFTAPSLPLPLNPGPEELINLYNLTTKVSSGYKVKELPPLASKQLGTILNVNDVYYTNTGFGWKEVKLKSTGVFSEHLNGSNKAFFAGGNILGFSTNILSFPFANDTSTSSHGTLTDGVYGSPGASSGENSYTIQGITTGPSFYNAIQKWPNTSSTPVTSTPIDTSGGSYALSSQPTKIYGQVFFGGNGAPPSPWQYLNYSSDTVVNTNFTYPEPGTTIQNIGVENASLEFGYAIGGGNWKIPFANHAPVVTAGPAPFSSVFLPLSPSLANPSPIPINAIGVSDTISGHGYQVGGGPTTPTTVTTISRFPFSTEVLESNIGNLSVGISFNTSGSQSETNGYAVYAFPGLASTIEKFPFASSTSGTKIGDPPTTRLIRSSGTEY